MQSVSNIIVNHEDEKFLSSFSEYRITPFSFFMLFFALLYESGKTHIKRDFSDEFYELKNDSRFSEIMQSIKFKSNGMHAYSNQIEESLYLLQTSDLLGKKNPSFGEILIEYNEDTVRDIKARYREDDIVRMNELVSIFLDKID